MDKTGAACFIYAKANGILGKSFTLKRAHKLFEVKSLGELWTLLFRTQPPMVPEVLLSQQIEEKAFSTFISQYEKFINLYDKPEPVLINQLLTYEGENLKEIAAKWCDKTGKHQTGLNAIFNEVIVLVTFKSSDSLIGTTQFHAEGFRSSEQVTVLIGQ